jgi:hypothetical protein
METSPPLMGHHGHERRFVILVSQLYKVGELLPATLSR